MLGVSSNLSSATGVYARAAAAAAAASTSRPSAGSCSCSGGSGGTCDCSARGSATGTAGVGAGAGGKALTPDQQAQIDSLKKRDAEVRQHEAAHLAAAGAFAKGGPVYNYQTGPDGKRYAVGGHVDVDTSAVAGDPKATLAKARQVQRAALAPADPSGQDHSVAASAAAQAAEAQAEIAADQTNPSGTSESTKTGRAGAHRRSPAAGTAAAAAYARSAGESAGTGSGLNVLG